MWKYITLLYYIARPKAPSKTRLYICMFMHTYICTCPRHIHIYVLNTIIKMMQVARSHIIIAYRGRMPVLRSYTYIHMHIHIYIYVYTYIKIYVSDVPLCISLVPGGEKNDNAI